MSRVVKKMSRKEASALQKDFHPHRMQVLQIIEMEPKRVKRETF